MTLPLDTCEGPAPVLTPDVARALLRECVTVVQPGETLVIRVPDGWTPQQVEYYQEYVDIRAPFPVLVVIGTELAVAKPEPEPAGFMKHVEVQEIRVFGSAEPAGYRLHHQPTGLIMEYPTREEAVWRLGAELLKRGDITVNDARAAYGLPPFPVPVDPFAAKAAQRGG